jgi:hypothetical protein
MYTFRLPLTCSVLSFCRFFFFFFFFCCCCCCCCFSYPCDSCNPWTTLFLLFLLLPASVDYSARRSWNTRTTATASMISVATHMIFRCGMTRLYPLRSLAPEASMAAAMGLIT